MKKVVMLLVISLIMISSASAAYYDSYFDVQTGQTGDQVCMDNGGICTRGIHEEVVCKLLLNWWGNYCGEKDCSWKNIYANGWIKANCLCTNTQPYCDGPLVKKRESNCQVYKIVKNCADEDRICSVGNCGRCVDAFHDESGICIPNEQGCQASCVNGIGAIGTKTWTNGKWNACSATTCVSCNTGYHLENGRCVINPSLSCASPALSGAGIMTNTGSPTISNQAWVYDSTTPYSACSWRCDSGYNKGTGNNCVADTMAPTVTVSYTNGIIRATTSEKATCRYATSNIAYTSMSSMTCETGECTSQVKTISLAGVTVYVKCRDSAGNEGTNSVNIPIVQPSCKTTGECTNNNEVWDCSGVSYWCSFYGNSGRVCRSGERNTGRFCEEAAKCGEGQNPCKLPGEEGFFSRSNLNICLKQISGKKQVCCKMDYGEITTDWCDVTEIK